MGMFSPLGHGFRRSRPQSFLALAKRSGSLIWFSQYAVYHDEGEIAAKAFCTCKAD